MQLGWKLTIRGSPMPFRTFGSHVCCSVCFMVIYKSAENFVVFPEMSASNINISERSQVAPFRWHLLPQAVTAKELGLNQQGIDFPEYTTLGLEKEDLIHQAPTRQNSKMTLDPMLMFKWLGYFNHQQEITLGLTYKYKSLVIFSSYFLNVSNTLLSLIKWVFSRHKLVSPKDGAS